MGQTGFKRTLFSALTDRLKEPRRHLQVLLGPRQVGKTTLVFQCLERIPKEQYLYISADGPKSQDPQWLLQHWKKLRSKESVLKKEVFLVIDEVQKIPNWAEAIKALWDEDTQNKRNIKVLLLGSSSLLIQKGLTESLAGRFEVLRLSHWFFHEMKEAFGFTLDEYIYFGGYPGSAGLIKEERRWKDYIKDSLIDTVLTKDILFDNPINKPALLKQMFYLGAECSGQIISYEKILTHLGGLKHTATAAHYLDLLSQAGLITGLQKFSHNVLRKRRSKPKFQVQNTALMSCITHKSFKDAKKDTVFWGRLVESCIGASLWNACFLNSDELFYWNDSSCELDFVLKRSQKICAIEVKSGEKTRQTKSLQSFEKKYKPHQTLLIGPSGLNIKDFLRLIETGDIFSL